MKRAAPPNLSSFIIALCELINNYMFQIKRILELFSFPQNEVLHTVYWVPKCSSYILYKSL